MKVTGSGGLGGSGAACTDTAAKATPLANATIKPRISAPYGPETQCKGAVANRS